MPPRNPAPIPAFAGLILRLLPLFLILSVGARSSNDSKKSFNIPSGVAGQTLKQFAAQAGCEIVFSAALVSQVSTNAVEGEWSPNDALKQMLANTPLVATQDQKTGAIAVRRKAE